MFKDNHITNKQQPLFVFSFKIILILIFFGLKTDCHVKKKSYISSSHFKED